MKLPTLKDRYLDLFTKYEKGIITIEQLADMSIDFLHKLDLEIQPHEIIPMDDEGNVLEEPKDINFMVGSEPRFDLLDEAKALYRYALQRVLFKGGEYDGVFIVGVIMIDTEYDKLRLFRKTNGLDFISAEYTINDLAITGVELTDAGIKYFGLSKENHEKLK